MKKTKHDHSKRAMALIVMVLLVFGSLGSTSVMAADSDMLIKQWDRLVGSSGTDSLNGTISTMDGNFVSVGSSTGNGLIYKTNVRGMKIWQKTFSGSGSEGFSSVIELSDGSLLAAGSSNGSVGGDVTDPNNGGTDGLLVKFDANGIKLWDKQVGGTRNDAFYDIIPTSDGGFLAVGTSRSAAGGEISDSNNGNNTNDGYIVKFDSAGNRQWDNLFGSDQTEFFNSVIQTSDGGYVVAGSAAAHDFNGTITGGEITDISLDGNYPHDGLLVKFNASGTMVWNNLFGCTSYDDFYGIASTADGGFLVVGRTVLLNGDVTTGEVADGTTFLIAKFNGAGTAQWNRAFTGGGYGLLRDVAEAPDGSILTVGRIEIGNPLNTGGIIAKLTNTGSLVGTLVTGGDGVDEFFGMDIDSSGHVVAVGNSTSSQTGDILSTSKGEQDGLMVHYVHLGDPKYSYNVSFEENGGSTVQDQVVVYGDKLSTPVETLRPGFTFSDWYTDSVFSQRFSINGPIIEDLTLFAKWNLHVMINSILSTDHTVSGIGQPGFSVVVTLPNGTKVETKVASDRKWSIQLPQDYQLKAGDKVNAAMYDIFSDGVEVSSNQRTVTAAVIAPDTGDDVLLFPVCMLLLLLSMTVMVGVRFGPKTNR